MNTDTSNDSDPLDSVALDILFDKKNEIEISDEDEDEACSRKIISINHEVPSISSLPPRLRFKFPQEPHPLKLNSSQSQSLSPSVSSSSESEGGDILVPESSDVEAFQMNAPRRSLRYLGISPPEYRKETIIDDIEAMELNHFSKKNKKSFFHEKTNHEHLFGKLDPLSRRFSTRSKPQIKYNRENNYGDEEDLDDLLSVNSSDSDTSMSDEEKIYTRRRNRRNSVVHDSSDIEMDDTSDEEDEFDPVKRKKKAHKNTMTGPLRCLDYLLESIYEAPTQIDYVLDHLWVATSTENNSEEGIFWIERIEVGEAGIKKKAIPSQLLPISFSKIVSSKKLWLLIKWKDRSHWWNTWVPYHRIGSYCSSWKKADIYIQKHIIEGDNTSQALISGEDSSAIILDPQEFNIVQRELLLAQYRSWLLPEKILAQEGNAVLVKWTNLPYSDCTWELLEKNTQTFPLLGEQLTKALKVFTSKEREGRLPSLSSLSPLVTNPKNRPVFVKMDEQPPWLGANSIVLEEPSLPIKLQLRDYQLDGLNWLAYAWHRNINSLLADEMGLGKTIQSVAFISYLFEAMEIDGPFIVIVPLSTIQAWKRAFDQWAPATLTTLLYLGDAQSRKVIIDYDFYLNSSKRKYSSQLSFNVLLTTYELVMKDKSVLGSHAIKWALLIVDEAHRLKNANSLLYRTLKEEFAFSSRLLITGTPLQNSIQELYALLAFLEPTKFTLEDDQQLSSMLADNQDSSHILEELHASLKPHFLRRLKKDVERSLPMKQERILRVELSPLQKRLYKWILTRNYSELNRNYGNSSIKGCASLLNIVNELRKASSHPYLFEKSPVTHIAKEKDPEGIIFHSGKMVLLDALLKRLIDEGHRMLIFSQSVLMLDILSEFLLLRSIRHCRLDGSTPSAERVKHIEHFNSSTSGLPVFLLSTRAGGLGINLTAADTVIIYDSDWNPQNDLQAMARCHRIGQTKAVSVYRLVSKGTVEEEILERAKKKMVLDHLVIQKMDRQQREVQKEGSTTELQKILQFGAKALFDQPQADAAGGAESVSLFAQIMTANTFDTSSHRFEDEGLDLVGTSATPVTTQSTQFQALFSRPASIAMLDLDAILIKAEDTLATEEKLADDESFLDSFRVADLSGALAWSEIIPKTELVAADRVNQEASDRVKAIELQQEGRKRSRNTTIVHTPGATAESTATNEKESGVSSGILSLWNSAIIERAPWTTLSGIKSHLYPQMKWLIYQVSSVGSRCIEACANESVATGEACSYLRLSTELDLNKFLWETLEKLLRQLTLKIEGEKNEKGEGEITSSKVFGLVVAPPVFLKRVDGLDHLYRMVVVQGGGGDLYGRIFELLSQRRVQIKLPSNWSIPWTSKDDSFLMQGVVERGFGNWGEIIASIPALAKKVKLVGQKAGSIIKGAAPTEEHLKRRADYLLSVIALLPKNRKSENGKIAEKKSEKEPQPQRRAGGTMQRKLEFRPKNVNSNLTSPLSETAASSSVVTISPSPQMLPTDYRKVFKRLFLPVKNYLLMLDDDNDDDDLPKNRNKRLESDFGIFAREKTILFNVGMHIDALLADIEEVKARLDTLAQVTDKKEIQDLLWSFVYTCWSSSPKRILRSHVNNFAELQQLYKSISSVVYFCVIFGVGRPLKRERIHDATNERVHGEVSDPKVVSGVVYWILAEIGSGASATIFSAFSGSELVAIKMYKDISDEKEAVLCENECRVLEHLRGQTHCIRILNSSSNDGIIVLERGESTLTSMLIKRHIGSLSFISFFFPQMVKGVAALHKMNIIHCDIKPSNFVLCNGMELKLVDFGISRWIVNESDLVIVDKDNQMGTISYMAPESLQVLNMELPLEQSPFSYVKMGTAADIWAVGCILFEMMVGELPFPPRKTSIKDQVARIINPAVKVEIPQLPPESNSNVSVILWNHWRMVALSCLEKDPDVRIKTPELLSLVHKFL